MRLTVKKEEIAPGEGKYLPGELGKTHGVAVFRKKDGSFVVLSADCPHRHCNVDWDPKGRGWLCPCHGSAFSGEGTVKHPPAVDDLKKIPFEETGDAISFEPV